MTVLQILQEGERSEVQKAVRVSQVPWGLVAIPQHHLNWLQPAKTWVLLGPFCPAVPGSP